MVIFGSQFKRIPWNNKALGVKNRRPCFCTDFERRHSQESMHSDLHLHDVSFDGSETGDIGVVVWWEVGPHSVKTGVLTWGTVLSTSLFDCTSMISSREVPSFRSLAVAVWDDSRDNPGERE